MDIKNEIVTQAEKLFLKLGIKSVSMDDLSRALGMSKKTLYAHFPNKKSLVETVVETHVQREQVVIKDLIKSSDNALDELKKISEHSLSDIEGVSSSAVYDLQKYYKKSFDILIKDHNDFVIVCLSKNIKRGIEEGVYRDDVNPLLVAKIYAKSSQFVIDELADPKLNKKELVHELYNYHVHGIANAKGIKIWNKYFN